MVHVDSSTSLMRVLLRIVDKERAVHFLYHSESKLLQYFGPCEFAACD